MIRQAARYLVATALALTAAGCGEGGETSGERVSAQRAADMAYAIIEADRAVYTRKVVARLTGEQGVSIVDPNTSEPRPLAASERWQSEHGALPLPSQMFKMASAEVANGSHGVHYALLSQWPISDQNSARTDIEREGLESVGESGQPFYATESLGGDDYFTAVYPDVAVSDACVACHNNHPDSPRSDFEVGDVMGGVAIRIELGDGG